MDNQDQKRTHTPGHENHGVHVCHKCGWPFPNPHPSAKQRRAHKKICGTIEGSKVGISERQTHLNGSDDERVSDDDRKTPGSNNEKGSDGIGKKLIRSEDEVFSDAVADFSDSGQSPGVKDPLQQDSLDSVTDVERVNTKKQTLSGSSEYNDFNAADASPLIVKSSEDRQIKNPKNLQSESVEVGNIVGLQGQLSGSTVDPLTSSVANLRTEELSIVHGDVLSDLSSDSSPSKAESMPVVLPEKNIYAGENVTDCSLTCVEEESYLKGKNEAESERDMVEFLDSSDNILGEACEGVSKIAVSQATQPICHGDVLSDLSSYSSPSKAESMSDVLPEKNIYAGENVTDCSLTCVEEKSNLKGKNQAESGRDMVEFLDSSDNILGEACEGVSKIAVSDVVSLDHEVGDGAITPKEKKGPEFLSLPSLDEFPLELNSSVITNKAQVESAHAIQSTGCGDVKVLQEKEEGNANIDPLPIPMHDDRLDVAYPQSESLKHEEGVTEENNFHLNTSQLSEGSDVLSPDMHVMDSNMKMETEDRHAEDCTEVSPVKLTLETYQRSLEIGESMKTELNHFSEEQGPEGSLMVSSNESQRDASFGSTVGETIHIDNISRHMKNTNEINDVAVDGNDVGANVENDIEIILNDFQPSDLRTEVKQSSDLFKNEDDDAGEMGKIEECEITDAHCKQTPTETYTSMPESDISHFESQVIPDVGIDGSARKSNGAECRNMDPVSDMNEDNINSNIKLYEEHNTSVDTSTDSHEARDAQLLVKAAEDLASKHTSDSSINAEPSAQQDSAVEADSGGDPGGDVSGITAMPVQDQSGSNSVKLGSSGIDTSADSHEVQDYAQLLVKAAEDLASKYASHSSINTKPSAQHDSSVEVNTGEKRGGEVSRITAVPVQDQSGNNSVKLSSSGIDASVDSSSRCDSMDGNWGSVSVLSMQSDAPAVIDTEILPSTRSLELRQAGKSNLKIPQAAADRHQSGKSEMFEPPSFMTLVEPSHVVSPKGAASEVQNPQQPNFTSQAGWFPTLNQVINESQGRKKDEEIIAKVTNWSNIKEHTPLKSLLGEATYNNKPKSPKMEENNGSGLTTVNSILCPGSPAAQADKGGEAANEWNSPARYPANIKREKRKIRSRPFWIQLVCCSTVDPRRR